MREAERRRIARDLHDGVLQDLSYTTATMGLIMLQVGDEDLEQKLQTAIDAIRRAGQGLRDAVNDLRLAEEPDRPLPEMVESLVQRNRAMSRGQQIRLEVHKGFPTSPLGNAGTQIFRIIQEALTNARRHSGAGEVLVTLGRDGDTLIVEVSDDGRGFEPGAASGVGLGSIRERAATLGASAEIESAPGQGARVRVELPQEQQTQRYS